MGQLLEIKIEDGYVRLQDKDLGGWWLFVNADGDHAGVKLTYEDAAKLGEAIALALANRQAPAYFYKETQPLSTTQVALASAAATLKLAKYIERDKA